MINLKLKGNKLNSKAVLLIIGLLIAALALSFGATALLTWVIFWCFNLTWSFKVALGIWCCMLLISMIFSDVRKLYKE